MSKDLPYFRFYPSEYNEGNITLLDMETQGLFINICSWYWKKDCSMTVSDVRLRLIKGQAPLEICLNNLIKSKIIKVDKEDNFNIEFLDEQFISLSMERDKKRLAGSLGGQASVKQRLSNGQAIKIDKDKYNNKDKDKDKEGDFKNLPLPIDNFKEDFLNEYTQTAEAAKHYFTSPEIIQAQKDRFISFKKIGNNLFTDLDHVFNSFKYWLKDQDLRKPATKGRTMEEIAEIIKQGPEKVKEIYGEK